jgi:hypothetical protein
MTSFIAIAAALEQMTLSLPGAEPSEFAFHVQHEHVFKT